MKSLWFIGMIIVTAVCSFLLLRFRFDTLVITLDYFVVFGAYFIIGFETRAFFQKYIEKDLK